jgi:hypothetical protein
MKTYNECHPTVRAHENTALWLNNEQEFNDILKNDALLRCFKTT